MKKIFLALVFVFFSFLSLSAQGLSEETKTRLLGRINSKTSYEVLDSIIRFKVFEAIPLLEQHFWVQPAFTSNKTYFLETLDTLNAPNLLSLSLAFLDSLKAGKFTFTDVNFESIGKTIPYYEGTGSAMQAFRICFKKNDFSRVEYFFEYLNNLESVYAYDNYLQPMLILAKNQEYKERLQSYFETIFKKVNSEWPKAIYFEKYQDIYKDEILNLAKYVAANDTSVSVRGNVIWKVLRKYRGPDLVIFYKERLVSETDESIILSSIPGLLKDHPSPQNYLFIKDRFNSFPDFVKSSLKIHGFNEYTPRNPDANISTNSLIDSLLSYQNQCVSFNWLGGSNFSSQLLSLLNEAKSKLTSGDSLDTALKIKQYQSLINEEYIDSLDNDSKFVTSDGYKFLYYFPQYILERLPKLPIIKTITPAITVTKTEEFILSAEGNYFRPTSVINWNGKPCKTTFVSNTLLQSKIDLKDSDNREDKESKDDYKKKVKDREIFIPVWVTTNMRINTDTLMFRLYKKLPFSVMPLLNCVVETSPTKYKAWFGYDNKNDGSALLDHENENKFDPAPQDRGQPTIFLPGKHDKVFSVEFEGNKKLMWKLDKEKVEASKDSPRCK